VDDDDLGARSIARYANITKHIRTAELSPARLAPAITVHVDVSTTQPSRPSPATHSHTLDRGLRALEVLARHPDGLSVSELAAALDTHRAAVYRLLGPLGDHHLVRRESDGRFTLAPGLIELAAGVRPRLQEVAEPVLQELADRLHATTALTIRDGDEAVVATVVLPREPRMHLVYRPGMRHPLTQGSPGHVLLAAMPPRPAEPAFVKNAREKRYAVSRGQLLPGTTGVAAAIAAPGHEPEASISAVWIEGLDPDEVALAVIAAAGEIANALWR
jgi:DNA-binding IclR family transcriptional regulator